MEQVVTASNITKFYSQCHVLDSISFHVRQGEFVSVVGPSGCGKTTLLKIIGGLAYPSEGGVYVNGMSAITAREKGKIGFVFQSPVLLPWRNVLKNVELPLEITGSKNPHEVSKRLLKIVGLDTFENSYPNELSGGMQQRVAIARALTSDPSLLLMDEPFGALDELTRDRMNLELLRIWKEEKTMISSVVFVTHSIPEAVFLSDRIIVMSERPASLKGIVRVNLPRPRHTKMKYSKKYIRLVECIRKMLKED
jgi:NitT/TauT family transport system ATP-binding protein